MWWHLDKLIDSGPDVVGTSGKRAMALWQQSSATGLRARVQTLTRCCSPGQLHEATMKDAS